MTERTAVRTDDAELVAHCLAGDEAAWDALVRRYAPLVWAVARRGGLSNGDAEDVFQTVWRIAIESLPRLRHPERFGRWLSRTTHFQSKRLLRNYSITRRTLERIPATDEDLAPPEEELERLEDRLRVSAALTQVGERCRELLGLLYYAHPTPRYAEIAERMGMRIGSIGPTRARCLERLERHLGDAAGGGS